MLEFVESYWFCRGRQASGGPAGLCLRRPCGALPPAALRGLPPAALRGFASGGPPGAPGAGGAQAPPAGEALLKTKKWSTFQPNYVQKSQKSWATQIL